MAMQPPKWEASGYIISCPAAASQVSSLQGRTPFFADSSLRPGTAVEMPQAAGLGPLAATSLQTRSSPAAIRRRSTEPY